MDDLAVGADHEFGRLDDAAAVFPPRSQRIRNFASHALADLERHIVLNFLGLFTRIDAGRDDLRADFFQFRLMIFEAD